MGPGPNARGLSRKHVIEAIDASLKRLGMDYVDLYQIHRFDYETPIEETLEALNDVVRAGKALYVGASSMCAWQFARMISVAREQRPGRVRLDAEPLQSRLPRGRTRDDAVLRRSGASPSFRGRRWRAAISRARARRRLATALRRCAAAPTPYTRVLGLGSRQDEAIRRRVGEAADKYGVKPAVIALAWVLSKPYVTAPIVGASKPHHLADAVAALALKLDARAIARLEEPYHPKEVVGHQ